MNTQRAIEIVVLGMRGCAQCEGTGLVEVSPEAPTGDCPRCREPGYAYRADGIDPDSRAEVQAAIAHLEADAQALADVRTLDEWQRAGTPRCEHWYTVHTLNGRTDWYRCNLFSHAAKEECVVHFRGDGPTPDAARHAAAEWVRGQEKFPSGAQKKRILSSGQQSGSLPHASTIGNDAERGTPLVFSTQCAVCSGPCQGHATQPSKGSKP